MDSFEINKIVGALLGTCLFVLALNIAAGAMFSPPKPAKPGYEIAVVEHPAAGSAATAAPEEPIGKVLASASVEKGETSAKKCQACHTFNKGEPNRVGPNLYGVVGRDRASIPGFNYSAAMKAKGGKWTIEELYAFLSGPKNYIPGTSMTFAGLPRGSERADVIAFLNTKSDHPAPLKAAEAPASDSKPGQAEAPAAAPKAGTSGPKAGQAEAPAAAPKAPAAAPKASASAPKGGKEAPAAAPKAGK
jgi:cytochrome c